MIQQAALNPFLLSCPTQLQARFGKQEQKQFNKQERFDKTVHYLPKASCFPLNALQQKCFDQFIPLMATIEGNRRFKADSLTNQLYRLRYPREWGVIVYGGTRVQPNTPAYESIKALGRALGSARLHHQPLHLVTGGGPGAMKAVSEGACSVGAHVVGSALEFIGEQHELATHPEYVIHESFHNRINGINGYEHRGAYTVAVPGGAGTMQEIWEKANTLFLDKSPYPAQKQIVLYDVDGYYSEQSQFWQHLEQMIEAKMVNPGMRKLFKLAKTPEDVVQLILDPSIPWTPGGQPGTPGLQN